MIKGKFGEHRPYWDKVGAQDANKITGVTSARLLRDTVEIKDDVDELRTIAGNNAVKQWTAFEAAEDNQWTSITWSPELELFCAVSSDGTNRVMTSPDGITWTARTAAEANSWRSVTWSPELELFCAVAYDGTNRVQTSPDGITWTAHPAAEDNYWRSVTWSPELELFCAVASSGTYQVMTSPDGTTWTARSAAEANEWREIAWSPKLSMFCVVATEGTHLVMTSPDGITWTARSAAEDNFWRSVTWSPELELFCAVAYTGTHRVMTSPDGTTWTARSAAEDNTWLSITWSSELELFCAVSSDGTHRVMTSPDGTTWTARSAAEDNYWCSVTWSPKLSMFCAVANNGTHRVMISGSYEPKTRIADIDGDTYIDVEETADIDEIVAKVAGVEAQRIHDNGIIDFPKQSACSVYLNTDQTVGSGDSNGLKIPFDTEIFDIQNEFDSVTNHRFTAKEDGKYMVSTQAQLHDLANIRVAIRVNKNGSLDKRYETATGSSFNYPRVFISYLIDLSANDYLEVEVRQYSGSNQTLRGAIGTTFLTIHKVG